MQLLNQINQIAVALVALVGVSTSHRDASMQQDVVGILENAAAAAEHAKPVFAVDRR